MDGVTGNDVELLSKTLQVEHKLFYFDLKENPRGRYLKISEKTTTSRSTIIVPESGIVWFVNIFSNYADKLAGNVVPSRELQMDTKVFYFDIGENPRGRYLKVAEASATSVRSTIIIPCGKDADDGWVQFRDVLVQIHESLQLMVPSADGRVPAQINPPTEVNPPAFYGNGPARNGSPSVAAAMNDSTGGRSVAKVLRAEQKKFFFDLGSNARGQYLRISEVIGSDRSAIILPASALEQFHETIGQFVKMIKVKDSSDGVTGATAATSAAALP